MEHRMEATLRSRISHFLGGDSRSTFPPVVQNNTFVWRQQGFSRGPSRESCVARLDYSRVEHQHPVLDAPQRFRLELERARREVIEEGNDIRAAAECPVEEVLQDRQTRGNHPRSPDLQPEDAAGDGEEAYDDAQQSTSQEEERQEIESRAEVMDLLRLREELRRRIADLRRFQERAPRQQAATGRSFPRNQNETSEPARAHPVIIDDQRRGPSNVPTSEPLASTDQNGEATLRPERFHDRSPRLLRSMLSGSLPARGNESATRSNPLGIEPPSVTPISHAHPAPQPVPQSDEQLPSRPARGLDRSDVNALCVRLQQQIMQAAQRTGHIDTSSRDYHSWLAVNALLSADTSRRPSQGMEERQTTTSQAGAANNPPRTVPPLPNAEKTRLTMVALFECLAQDVKFSPDDEQRYRQLARLMVENRLECWDMAAYATAGQAPDRRRMARVFSEAPWLYHSMAIFLHPYRRDYPVVYQRFRRLWTDQHRFRHSTMMGLHVLIAQRCNPFFRDVPTPPAHALAEHGTSAFHTPPGCDTPYPGIRPPNATARTTYSAAQLREIAQRNATAQATVASNADSRAPRRRSISPSVALAQQRLLQQRQMESQRSAPGIDQPISPDPPDVSRQVIVRVRRISTPPAVVRYYIDPVHSPDYINVASFNWSSISHNYVRRHPSLIRERRPLSETMSISVDEWLRFGLTMQRLHCLVAFELARAIQQFELEEDMAELIWSRWQESDQEGMPFGVWRELLLENGFGLEVDDSDDED